MTQDRPLSITIVCIIGFVAFGLSVFSVPMMYGTITAAYGVWFGPIWLVSLAVTLASLIGYWQMKKWGVYLYLAAFISGTVMGILFGLPFTVVGVVAPLLISALGLAYLRRME
ncbi:MAG: hypothetical protein DCC55_32315 [Chloroflexi bacterium]|nr:MAG: hypothetical protein DCC55_32315 [Chloroflexota bacterium]